MQKAQNVLPLSLGPRSAGRLGATGLCLGTYLALSCLGAGAF